MIRVGDLALTDNFDTVGVEAIKNGVAECRYTYDFKGEDRALIHVDKLIRLTPETAEKARRALNKKIAQMNTKLHELNDCANYVS